MSKMVIIKPYAFYNDKCRNYLVIDEETNELLKGGFVTEKSVRKWCEKKGYTIKFEG